MSDTFIADLDKLRTALSGFTPAPQPCPHIRSSGATNHCELAADDARDAARYRHLRDHHLRCIAHPAGRDWFGVGMDAILPGDDAPEAIDDDIRRMRDATV